MKITIMYNYNMESPTIYRVNQRIYIKNNQSRYMLLPIQSNKELNEIYTILRNNKINNQYYKFVKTMNNKLTIIDKGIEYVLIKLSNITVELEEKINNKPTLQKAIYMLDRSNWYFLWSKKNDYIEYKSAHIKKKYKIIDESIDYYLGMAETAITYLKSSNTNPEEKRLTLTHRRLTAEEIHNPLNIIIDIKERDISEYLKYLFINKKNNPTKIKQILLEKPDSQISYSKIYARLLYPNYYFDLYEGIELGIEKEEKLQELIRRIDEYEVYLRDVYKTIIIREKIKNIDWL